MPKTRSQRKAELAESSMAVEESSAKLAITTGANAPKTTTPVATHPRHKRNHGSTDSTAARPASKKPKTMPKKKSGTISRSAAGEHDPDPIRITVTVSSETMAKYNGPPTPMSMASQQLDQSVVGGHVRHKTSLEDRGEVRMLSTRQHAPRPSGDNFRANDCDDSEDWGEVTKKAEVDFEIHKEYREPDSDEDESETPWLEGMASTATWRGRKIGCCCAELIRRDKMRADFWQELDEPSSELRDFSFNMFNRHGLLRAEYYDHEFRKGTGVWGKELDHGDILHFSYIKVDREWRRRGVAQRLVKAILDTTLHKVHRDTGFFAMTNPGAINAEQKQDEDHGTFYARELPIALSFWRSLGFRRVGVSYWFAFANQPDHPSRLLDASQDWQRFDQVPEKPFTRVNSDEVDCLFNVVYDKDNKDSSCLELIRTTLPKDRNDKLWLSTYGSGNNLLHVAAIRSRAVLVKEFLATAPQLLSLRNEEGRTPLEALQAVLEEERTRPRAGRTAVATADMFQGFYSPWNRSMACLSMLQNIDVLDLSTLGPNTITAISTNMDEELPEMPPSWIDLIRRTLRLHYGCTCGECLGGFLSPRMKFHLLCEAESNYNTLKGVTGDRVSFLNLFPCRDRPFVVDLRTKLEEDERLRHSFVQMLNHFAECLRKNINPLDMAVYAMARSRPDSAELTRYFLDCRGSVRDMRHMLFTLCMETDEYVGDGSHRAKFGAEIDALPACRNDHEFAFARNRSGSG